MVLAQAFIALLGFVTLVLVLHRDEGFEVFVAHLARDGVTATRDWSYDRKDATRRRVSLAVGPITDEDGRRASPDTATLAAVA